MQQLPKSCELNLFLEFYYGTIMQDMCDPNAHFIFGSALVRLPNMENAHGQVLLGDVERSVPTGRSRTLGAGN
jgi:hypothetical protein